jgi:transcriptional regulator with PAS, ATPase and Fis domain/tetratricopeptide (TPR) repeat protein
MDGLAFVKQLIRAGRFRAALHALDSGNTRRDTVEADVIRASLYVRTGHSDKGHAVISRLSRSELTPWQRSFCEQSLALSQWAIGGDTNAALRHIQRAIANAIASKDLERLCWCQLEHLKMLGELAEPHAVMSLLAQLRTNVLKLGDPVVTAALHIIVGQADGQRGLRRSASKHTELGLRLLESEDSAWLKCFAQNTRAANALMDADNETGIAAVEHGLSLAESVGPITQATLYANLGLLNYKSGKFSSAIECLQRAMNLAPVGGQRRHSLLDSLACVFISQGRLDEAECHLGEITDAVKDETDWLLHCNRHSRITLVSLLLQGGNHERALAEANFAIDLARRADDRLLLTSALLSKANALWRMGIHQEVRHTLEAVILELAEHSAELLGHYESILAGSLISEGKVGVGRLHYERARRIFDGLHNVPRRLELESILNCAGELESSREKAELHESHVAGSVLQDIAILLLHSDKPELVALTIVAIFERTGSVHKATVLTRTADGSSEILASIGDSDVLEDRTIELGQGGNTIELVFKAREDSESIATVNAVTLLARSVRELQRARAEREEHMALWPIEELPPDDENAVINGRMREVMAFARRVAPTTASVLITGESGTGKEIVARAIHRYSTRAQKPFIPFNCTAIPREMLESQLFGHRRGAFTSADRDNPGLIRAARDGTLFLDEIGELGTDLQPKLLRFLESGEICPLGESTPINVDVRIVAATNRNLEDLVREGRFREDLFYRLNVIRVTLPPLRERRDEIPPLVYHFVMRAAGEFKKGRVRIADETMEHLLLYAWPGNIRQLHNEIRRMVALTDADSILKPAALSQDIRRATAKPTTRATGQIAVSLDDKLTATISRIEREMIRSALRAHQGQLEEAARALGISRKGLYLKRQRLGL